jgi:serine/threonine protein kinase
MKTEPKFEEYRNIRKIDSGSFGSVYEVHCIRTNTNYAMKEVKNSVLADPYVR